MPSLKDIRNRVRSVKNTQKITRAMKLVAAAKLKRAQLGVEAARPYAHKMHETIKSLVAEADPESDPLFRVAEAPDNIALVPMTSNRGLCGGFNANLTRRVAAFRKENAHGFGEILVSPLGRKGFSYFNRRDIPSAVDLTELDPNDPGVTSGLLTEELVKLFKSGEVDEVYLVFNEFKSAMTQEVVFQRLLPLSPETFQAKGEEHTSGPEFIYEPDKATLLSTLLPQYVESQVLRALLESNASEQGARMTAMDSATNNASDLIDKLTLQMNRARQAAITTELMEITSGAEALKG
ncbi:MAG: F-type H+-transporting ATPase subunit gamma [Bradymonadia bacterium]|jgi:F-type H+-transporting ATPase subunit gamma